MPVRTQAKRAKLLKAKKMLRKQKPPRMTPDEKRLIREMHFDRGMKPAAIAKAVGRHISNVCRLIAQKKQPKPTGRRPALTETQIDRAANVLEEMVDAAEADYEVTCAMVKRRCRFKVCDRALSDALHSRGYWFRGLRKKMILSPADVSERYEWAKKFRTKPLKWWLETVHIHLDNHQFKVATTPSGRKLLAKRRTRGVYRKKQKSLRAGHVKPDSRLHVSTGSKGILKMGGVGGGKVLVWHTIVGSWGGEAAASAYKDAVLPALKRRYPRTKTFTILEDNDPTGNLSKVGIAAKKDCKMKVFRIPKRSPDLNVLDFSIWAEVERRMRLQERKMRDKRENRSKFEERLDRTAFALPSVSVKRSVGALMRRCQLLYDAEGGLFEEGGRSRRPL